MSEAHTDAQGSEIDTGGTARTLGSERWVQFAFVAIAAIAFWLADRLVTAGWSFFAEPKPTVVSAVAAVIGIGFGAGLYKNAKSKTLATEVAAELSKVTWPSRPETRSATVVVIITSLIAAVILGLFDTAWSAVTDLIYHTGN